MSAVIEDPPETDHPDEPDVSEEPDEPERPPAAGSMTNVITAVAVVVLGGATLAGSLSLGVGTPSTPGPGTWPALVGAALILLGGGMTVRARHFGDAERFTRSGLLVLTAVASMAAYVAVIGTIGFEIPTAMLAFVWLRFLGRETWRTSTVLSLAVTVAFYLLFVVALDVTIPHRF